MQPPIRDLSICGSLLPPASADVRTSDDVIAFEGWYPFRSLRTTVSISLDTRTRTRTLSISRPCTHALHTYASIDECVP